MKRLTYCDQMGFIPGMQVWPNIQKLASVIYHINRIKGKNHTVILMDVEKSFNKNSLVIMIKTHIN